MSVADLMQALADAGAPMEAIIIAVRAVEEKDAEIERRRAVERDRKRRQRDGTVTGQSRDASGTVTDNPSPQSPPLESPPDPQKITPPLTPQPVIERRARGIGFSPPEGVTFDQFSAFCKQRKKKLTDHAYSLLCGKLKQLEDAGYPPGQMIDLAIERGWETVFEPKEYGNGRQQPANTLRGNRPDPALDMLRRAQRELEAERGNPAPDSPDWLALPSVQSH